MVTYEFTDPVSTFQLTVVSFRPMWLCNRLHFIVACGPFYHGSWSQFSYNGHWSSMAIYLNAMLTSLVWIAHQSQSLCDEFHISETRWSKPTVTRARFLSLTPGKLRLYSANHRPGYWSNLPYDWPSTASAYSEQETENGPWYWWLGESPQVIMCMSPVFRRHPLSWSSRQVTRPKVQMNNILNRNIEIFKFAGKKVCCCI